MTSAVDLAVALGEISLPSPILTASGTSGHGAELAAYFDLSQLGAVVVKSLSADPWPGNRAPRVVPVEGGMLNSVGLQGPGVNAWIEHDLPGLVAAGARVIASIWGRRVEDFARAAELLRPVRGALVAVEVNISCPNVEDRSRMFAHSPRATREVLEATQVCGRPRIAKLSPNVADIAEIAAAAQEGGACAVALINTVPGLDVDIERRLPRLGGIGGGLSGPAVRAVALRAVYDCYAQLPTLPIIGVGGVRSGEHAVALMMAGASAVGIGTATLERPRATLLVQRELVRWCRAHGVDRVGELTGVAHG
ncbi:MAG TPA: dihydroorotate dehydrogenase [Acidimicrobiales bacterium]|nr:dihydroorotate dehydrogenase [Acidimicrobiales bacterium]